MARNRQKKEKGAETARQLRRLAASDDNRRRLQAMPLFTAEPDTPDRFERLLQRLDYAEAARPG